MIDRDMIDEVKRNNSIVDTARRLGLELHREGRDYRSYSIFNKGDNNNCTVFNNDNGLFYDFKAGIGGDVIDLVAELKFNGDKGAAINELSGDRAYVQSDEYKNYVQSLQADINKWHADLRPEDIEYLTGRRLTREYINKMRLGYNSKEQRLIIPYFERGQVVYYTGRDMTGKDSSNKYKKAYINGFNKSIIWGVHTLDRTDKPLIIAEGAFDAMSCDIAGYRVLASMGGLSKRDIAIICGYAEQENKSKRDVHICFDNDSAGHGFYKSLAKELLSHRLFNFKRLELPAQYKDISEYYADGGDLQALIDSPIDGVAAFADTFAPIPNETQGQTEKRETEFKNFMLSSGRFIAKDNLINIVNSLISKGYFAQNWLAELLKQATNAPFELDVIDKIRAEHDIIYKAKAGFYEYDGVIWNLMDDDVISSYISSELGRVYSTGKRISSVRTNFRANAIYTGDFDKKPLYVFQNGTLNIETDIFKAHDMEDRATILLPYPYDPAAACPNWKQFLEDICWAANKKWADKEGDARIDLLQEFAGYILFTDCRLQKALLLYGEGENGKSTFLDVLIQVFGKKNFADIEIDKLGKQFQAVELIGKLANVSTETGLNFGGAESMFKKLVAGEDISDCYKGKDFFSFNTRAKFLIAANTLPRSKDTTYGFNRRFTIVKFQNKFVDDHKPDPAKLERLKDINLKYKLMAELPGIFNWAYAGYKRLKERGRFTESPDNKTLMDEFIRNNNPVISFVEDKEFKTNYGILSRGAIYKDYQDWCKENGYMSKNREQFFKDFRAVLQQQDIKFKESQPHGCSRVFEFNIIEYSD